MASVSILSKPLSDPAVTDFLMTMLTHYWERCELPAHQIPGIFTLLQRNAHNSEQAMEAINYYYSEITRSDSRFAQRYRQARAGKFDHYAEYLTAHIQPGTLIDIGAGDTQLADCLVSRSPAIARAYATDIFPCDTPPSQPNVEFIVQDSPTSTPFTSNSASTVIISTMLHHMQTPERQELLEHVFAILKPGGNFLLVEDSFPTVLAPEGLGLDYMFSQLNIEQRMQCLCFLDWWGNRLMKNRPEIPLPCAFKTIDEWQEYLCSFGFRIAQVTFYGFPPLPTHMVSPKTIIVARKPRAIA